MNRWSLVQLVRLSSNIEVDRGECDSGQQTGDLRCDRNHERICRQMIAVDRMGEQCHSLASDRPSKR